MVIRKAKNATRSINAKSLLIFAVTWTLWIAAAVALFLHHEALIYKPIVGTWNMIDLIKAVAVVTLTQLNILFCWSILATSRISALRNRRRYAARTKSAIEWGNREKK